MARVSSDNLFGISDFIVDPLDVHGSFNTIQSAIDAANSAGGGVVYIKKGTYTENLTLHDKVYLSGVCVDGRLQNFVTIAGNHIFNDSGTGFGICIVENIDFESVGADLLTMSPSSGVCAFACKYCLFNGATGRAAVIGGGAGFASFNSTECTFAGASVCLDYQSNSGGTLRNCQLGGAATTFLVDAATVDILECNVTSSTNAIFVTSASSLVNVSHSNLISMDSTIRFSAAGTVNSSHNTHQSSAASEYVTGFPLGATYNYADDVLTGTATTYGTITAAPRVWKPYATSGLTGTAVRGTAAFDSTDFTVTDGFVTFTGSTAFPWVDRNITNTVVSNEGNFVTSATVQLTLPAAPAQGDTCKFKDPVGIAPYVIQANAGQTLQVANQTSSVAGSASSSAIGDAMELTFYAAGNVWVANSIIGNWNVI